MHILPDQHETKKKSFLADFCRMQVYSYISTDIYVIF